MTAFSEDCASALPGLQGTISRERVVLGLGSNRGDSSGILRAAMGDLQKRLSSFRAAPFYKTRPLLVEDQPDFLNTAVAGFFDGSPRDLLAFINGVERSYGRDRSREQRWGERTLDIDILLFGERIVREGPELEIPHPRLGERRFALQPLLDLVPDAMDPVSGRTWREIMDVLPQQGIYYAGASGYNQDLDGNH